MPSEAEDTFRQLRNELAKAAQILDKKLSGKPGAIHVRDLAGLGNAADLVDCLVQLLEQRTRSHCGLGGR